MTRFEDTLPPNTEAVWSPCGHVGGAVCAECFRILAEQANRMAQQALDDGAEILRLREIIRRQGDFR